MEPHLIAIILGVAAASWRAIRPRMAMADEIVMDFNEPDIEYATVDSQPTRPSPPAPATGESSDRVVRIMMLGFSASGKSTFLAAMWHYFGYGDCDGIIFSTDENSARYLNGYCRELIQGRVPSQTATTKEWKFTVQARGLSNNLTDTFTLTYIDYDGKQLGGIFYDPDDVTVPLEGSDSRVLRAISEYDVIMGLLDGAKIAEIMRDNPDPEYAVWLEQLFFLIAGQGDKPVHLLLTKFDLLDGRYTLGQIAEKLRSRYSPFDQYCDFPRMGKKRLIPVAALGTNGFVRPGPDGSMEINTAVKWDSRSVERPLVCTLPDVLDTALAKLGGAAPGYRPTPQSRGLRWENYSQALYWAASIFTVDASIAKGYIDLTASTTAAALVHLTKLLSQHDSKNPVPRIPWRRQKPPSTASDVAVALEHVITCWSARARYLAKDEKHGYMLAPHENQA
jgi:hypothetical protein